jgi:hypothetical protein
MPLVENGVKYLTATEAANELEVSRQHFYTDIRPLLTTHQVGGRTREYYNAEDVQQMRGKIAKHSSKSSAPGPKAVIGAKLVRMEPTDMVRVAPVLSEHWGPPNIERWSGFIERNPEIGYMLVSDDDKVVGCGFLFPHTEEKILDILSKEVTPPTEPDELLLYNTSGMYNLYARTLCITLEGTATQRRFWGALLIRNLMRVFISLGGRGIEVRRIYGRSDTPEGEKLMRDVGFTQIRTVTSHKNFMIDVPTSGLDIVLRYERELNNWKLRHGGEGI